MKNKDLDGMLYGQGFLGPLTPGGRGPLRGRYAAPPFSLLDTKDGAWQARKKAWIARGIKSEVGRDAAAYSQEGINQMARGRNKKIEPGGGGGPNSAYKRTGDDGGGMATGTSIFDPVLAEICYRWWCPPGGVILDPFAGGSVRGIVASLLGYKYWGCDLRQAQIDANIAQLGPSTVGNFKPKWVCGDSLLMMDKAPAGDFLFTCPPYGDLEVYSDDPNDISTMTYGRFIEAMRMILRVSCNRLKDDTFAAIVVGNYRDKKTGHMRNFTGDTIRAFQQCGLEFWNDAVLENAIGSAGMRSNTSFIRGHRKLVKVHQNVLVFIKGDAKAAAAKLPMEIFDDAD